METEGAEEAESAVAAAEAAALDAAAQHFARMLFAHRLRTGADRAKLAKLFAAVWSAGGGASQAPGDRKALAAHGPSCWTEEPPVLLSPTTAVVGRAIIKRAAQPSPGGLSPTVASGGGAPQLQLLPWSLPLLESLVQALGRGWMALLVGGPGSGKTSLARGAAALAGVGLLEVALTAGTDTSDLLGSFEQLEPERRVQEVRRGRVRGGVGEKESGGG